MASITRIITAAKNSCFKIGIPFDYGRASGVNIYSEDLPQLAWLLNDSITSTNVFVPSDSNRLFRSHSFEIFFFQADSQGNTQAESQEIVEDVEPFAIKWLISLQDENDDFEQISATTTPVYKYSARGIFSGISLSVSLSFPDVVEYC